MTTPAEAQGIAESLLASSLPRRWAHTAGVAREARHLAGLAGPQADLLESAAWLHDVGYSPALRDTGFHPLDGAKHLTALGVDPRVISLVATHTNATIEADERGLIQEMAEFHPVDERLHRFLAYCDMTTSPDGEAVTIEDRLAEILARYPDGGIVSRSIRRAAPDLRVMADAVAHQLSAGA